jgi:hypothetical protein
MVELALRLFVSAQLGGDLLMARRVWTSWGEVFLYYLDVKGYDHGYAAYRADRWRQRQRAAEKKKGKVFESSPLPLKACP